MSRVIRIPRSIVDLAKSDLQRPHAFASERVGFLIGRSTSSSILVFDYEPLPETAYLEDRSVGVRYMNSALSWLMLRARHDNLSLLHAHFHELDCSRAPRFSEVDLASLKETMPAISGINPSAAHGAVVFSHRGASALLWPKPGAEPEACAITAVGFPTEFWGKR